MTFKIPCATIVALSNMLTCFDTMNQLVRLDIVPSGFELHSVDHDGTTVLHYITPIESSDGHYTGNAAIYVNCEHFLQYIERAHGTVYIDIREDPAITWSLRDTAGHTCVWSTANIQPPYSSPLVLMDSTECKVSIPSADILLYIQHITLCESQVNVSSCGKNDVSLCSQGELISIQIQNQPIGTTNVLYSVNCTFKYVRAVLSILQKTEMIDMFIVHGKCLFFKVDVFPGILYIILKDMTSY
jgi:hypothetical protein